ncbi:hypothetical protein [Phormidium sp. CCY1219]|uniref:hypothetical protein n=1 Tax=Phormidium sp. CCY1219 TaxID=2886104 RepID=UPI002D1EE8C4|nr:hypothetical protein [Phormidium sp. CCY1219]MEB3829270.1 hypothetical protein [Phormidium sp. CCY1219]
MRVGGLLACKQFTWSEWLEPEPDTSAIPISDWLERFEQDYFNKRARTPKTETSFRDYLKAWELFSDRHQPLTKDSILAAVIKSDPDSRARKRACIALGALAKFASIEIDLKPYQGKYSPYSAIEEKELPSDELIVQWRDRNIPRTFPVRNVGTEPAPLMEMLEQSDYLLLATNGTERRTQFAKNYFDGLGKPIWEVLIPDERTDEGEPADSPEPPNTEPPPQPDSDRRPNSVGNCRITNIRDTGDDGLSSTSWHNNDFTRVYIGRGGSQGIARSPLHNPYPISESTTREQSIHKFKRYSWPLIRDEISPFYPAIRNVASLLAQGHDRIGLSLRPP